MIYSVADRFKFAPRDIWGMKIKELKYWYSGVLELNKHEEGILNGGKTND